MSFELSRRGATQPFLAMDVLARANELRRAGHDVISLAVGQPSDPAPTAVLEAARQALASGRIGYTDSLGIAALREAISRHYGDHYGLDIAPRRVVITTGSSAGFNLAFLACFDVGDRVAIASPGYPAYRSIMAALGLDVVEIAEGPEGYLTTDRVDAVHRERPLKGLLFASPANPTGAMLPPAEMARLVDWSRQSGTTLISDEIYHRLSYTGEDKSALSLSDEAVVINSFSKYYCMTGWRIGWMVVPEQAVRQIECLQQSLYISAPELSQIAATQAFGATAELEAVKARYRGNRELLAQALPSMGFSLAAPMDGAFYAYCDVSRHTNDSMDFARRALDEAHVAFTPGLDFDLQQGHRAVRLSYAGSTEDVRRAVERLGKWLGAGRCR